MAEQRIDVVGLDGPVEIVVDRWGIPHIQAQSNRDLFFAQGFGTDRLAAGADEADLWFKMTPLGEVIREQNTSGSNNWVIAGDRTDTGRPIMANDPHRAHAIPSLRYIVRPAVLQPRGRRRHRRADHHPGAGMSG